MVDVWPIWNDELWAINDEFFTLGIPSSLLPAIAIGDGGDHFIPLCFLIQRGAQSDIF